MAGVIILCITGKMIRFFLRDKMTSVTLYFNKLNNNLIKGIKEANAIKSKNLFVKF